MLIDYIEKYRMQLIVFPLQKDLAFEFISILIVQ